MNDDFDAKVEVLVRAVLEAVDRRMADVRAELHAMRADHAAMSSRLADLEDRMVTGAPTPAAPMPSSVFTPVTTPIPVTALAPLTSPIPVATFTPVIAVTADPLPIDSIEAVEDGIDLDRLSALLGAKIDAMRLLPTAP